MRFAVWGLAVLGLGLAAGDAQAISVGAFGPNGSGGAIAGQTFQVGSDAEVNELDGFVVAGGSATGQALSSAPADGLLSNGLAVSFSSTLSADATDITLSYTLRNTTGAEISDVRFVSFLDIEIAEPVNTFFNEHATTTGTLAAGQSFEIDEPGFAFGDIYDNALAATLDNLNALPDAASADDASFAIGWSLGGLPAGGTETLNFLLSEDGDRIGTFSITQSETGPLAQDTTITFSSERVSSGGPSAAVPEPSAALLYAAGLGVAASQARRRRTSASPTRA